MTAERSPDDLRKLFTAPSWPPNGGRAEGGYVMVFSGIDTDDLGSPYRERFRVLATPEAFKRLGSGALVEVPDTIALVELITPDGLCIDSRLVLMTDPQSRADAVEAIRYAIDNDPGPVPVEP
jgi:hypothetical protein